MAFISSRASVFAIKKEVTEGTPVFPASGADFVALQEDYQLSSAFDTLENTELTGTIGAAKPTLGAENPTLSFSHYLRGSGVEGQEADYGELMEATFGAKSVASTEYNTVSGSTVSVINVDTGEGANFARGQALLIKDGTNGYSIRNIYSIATDALTLSHNVAVAPGTGVNLGECVAYYPSNTHPSYTGVEYEGNGGLVQMITGLKSAGLEASFDTENFINASFNLEGISYSFNPVNITSADRYIDFNDGGVKVATIAAKVYRSPGEVAEALELAMNSVSTGITVSYSSANGKYTIAKASGTLSLLWDSGANTANTIGDVLGFDIAADDTSALSYESDTAIVLAAPYTPSYDAANPVAAKNAEIFLGDATEIFCFGVRNFSWSMVNTLVNVPDICEESGRAGKLATAREVTFEIAANASQYDVTKFEQFYNARTLRFAYNGGEKDGGNWVAGKCFNIFSPSCVISNFSVDKEDDLTIFNMTVTCFVENGLGEIYFNTL